MLACSDGNELSGAVNESVNTSAGCGFDPVLTAEVSITAMLPASHCETYTLKLLVLPPPEDTVKARKRAVPGVQGAAEGVPVDGPQSAGFVMSTGTVVIGITLLTVFVPVSITSTCVLTHGDPPQGVNW